MKTDHIVVNNDDDPKMVRSAIAGLRTLAALGRQAEEALAALKRGEGLDKPVRILKRNDGKSFYAIGSVRLPLRISVDKSHWMETMKPGIGFGCVGNEVFGQPTLKTFRILPTGQILRWGEESGTTLQPLADIRVANSSYSVATARVKSNGNITLEPNDLWTSERVPIVTVKPRCPKAQRSIAEAYTRVCVRLSDRDSAPQELMTLMKNLPTWIVEEGLAETWLDDIKKSAPVVIIMET